MTEWELPLDATPWLPDEPEDDGPALRPRIGAVARLAPTIGAGGAPLPPGEYDVRMSVSMAGFSANARVRRDEDLLTVTVTPSLRAEPSLPAEPPPPPPPPPPPRTAPKHRALRTALAVPGLVPRVMRVRAGVKRRRRARA
jgi:hypothetical protein